MYVYVTQASEEYLQLARSVEKKWTRELQSERDLRLRLQENLETMADQMYGLESEAQRTAEQRPRISSQGSREMPSSATSSETSLMLLVPHSPGGAVGGSEKRDEIDGGAQSVVGGGREGDSDDEPFFDAHEISAEEWAKSTKAEFLGNETDPSAVPEGTAGPTAADIPPIDSKSTEQVSKLVTVL